MSLRWSYCHCLDEETEGHSVSCSGSLRWWWSGRQPTQLPPRGPAAPFGSTTEWRHSPLGTGPPMLKPMYSVGKMLNLVHNRTSEKWNQMERPFPSHGLAKPERRRAVGKQALLCVAGGTVSGSALSEEQRSTLYGNWEWICPLTPLFF